jgi:regulator of protease activity HflC (stomatin/prohibitin superfamily)
MKKVLMCSVLMLFLNGCSGCVYFAEMVGRAKLAEAEGSTKIQIEDAKGKLESAKLFSDAEVERAKGVAAANKIIGDSLKNNESYLRYLYIQNLEKAEAAGSSVIYIPTEAGLPILEATRKR